MGASSTKHRRNVVIGYSIPSVITLLTLIAEMSLGRCAWGKPRFGEESCFFAGTYSLFNPRVWQYFYPEEIVFHFKTIRAALSGFMDRLLSCSYWTRWDVFKLFAFFAPMKTVNSRCICGIPKSEMLRWTSTKKSIWQYYVLWMIEVENVYMKVPPVPQDLHRHGSHMDVWYIRHKHLHGCLKHAARSVRLLGFRLHQENRKYRFWQKKCRQS